MGKPMGTRRQSKSRRESYDMCVLPKSRRESYDMCVLNDLTKKIEINPT